MRIIDDYTEILSLSHQLETACYRFKIFQRFTDNGRSDMFRQSRADYAQNVVYVEHACYF